VDDSRFSPDRFAPVRVRAEPWPDGGVLLASELELASYPSSLIERLEHWAQAAPDRPFLLERRGEGWHGATYAQALAESRALAARLLPLGLSPERPLVILAPNSVLHGLVMLAAMTIGVPAAPVSPAYCQPGGEGRLKEVLDLLTPGAVFIDGPCLAAADLLRQGGARLLAEKAGPGVEALGGLEHAPPEALAVARAGVGPDTIAKFLFTSGSTGSPKPVINTQRMLCSMQVAMAQVWPFLQARPPVLCDWLPWHHTFGGNHCLGIALHNGGSFHIDDGKPTPGLIGRTVENMRLARPTLHFNVPAGYDALLARLAQDEAAAREALDKLELLFNAAAAMHQSTRDRLDAVVRRALGRTLPVSGGWGATETSPEATLIHADVPQAENVGVPLPGVEIRLAPVDGRLEIRARGPDITPGYWRSPQATAAIFDDDGFYRSGDAGRLADPGRPEAGILFDGRIAENFKLSTGVWVNAGAVRLAAIHAAGPMVADAAVCGHDRDELGVLLFLAPGADRPAAHDTIRRGLAAHNRLQPGSSTRIQRFLVLDEPPSAEAGELTAKGSLNQARVLVRRAADVARLYGEGVRVTELVEAINAPLLPRGEKGRE
jgi:feruloyl-CoA synthase